ncbi:MAG: hypothetical protein LKF75_02100 [Bacilli bacterium]|jgi:hypothetical protein|nr:hypothetical protein [Bacilli bacterium]MCH4211051.1 hypothetical protein [Bacilli bacterium]MCH4228482.1 hypothetical protein [Bacilli bacterium]MCH4277582.1 hypothetical protein [Bacilli bacterium]MCI2054921.1 hypothetical protein [Bacilli bacterium]
MLRKNVSPWIFDVIEQGILLGAEKDLESVRLGKVCRMARKRKSSTTYHIPNDLGLVHECNIHSLKLISEVFKDDPYPSSLKEYIDKLAQSAYLHKNEFIFATRFYLKFRDLDLDEFQSARLVLLKKYVLDEFFSYREDDVTVKRMRLDDKNFYEDRVMSNVLFPLLGYLFNICTGKEYVTVESKSIAYNLLILSIHCMKDTVLLEWEEAIKRYNSKDANPEKKGENADDRA